MKKVFYIKSIYTGQVYEVEEMPKFGGYEMVGKAEYEAWKKQAGT